jgi:hypothetical protein
MWGQAAGGAGDLDGVEGVGLAGCSVHMRWDVTSNPARSGRLARMEAR